MSATINITTEDGICPAHVFQPAGTGPWPAVLFFMDGLGIRPALFEMGQRLTAHGYYVILPDLYYRSGPYEPMDARRIFGDPELRQTLFQNYLGKLGQANAMRDTRAEAMIDRRSLASQHPRRPVMQCFQDRHRSRHWHVID